MTERYLHPSHTKVDFSRLQESEPALRERQSDLFYRDLAPYAEDDAFLIRRIGGPNRLLKRAPELRPQIQEALLANDDESLIQLAGDLDSARLQHNPNHKKAINTILSFLNLLESINVIRGDLNAEDHIVPRLNTLFELMYRKTANSFPEELLNDAQLTTDYLIHRTQKLYDDFDNRGLLSGEAPPALSAINNLRIRLGGLYEAIRVSNEAHKYITGLPDDSGETISQQTAESDSQYTTELFTNIRASQRYGVKMGYIQEEQLGGALIFSPTLFAKDFSESEELRAIYHPLLDKTDAVAQIIHTQREKHRHIKASKGETHGYSTVGFENLGPSTGFTLGSDGELYTWRDCAVSLRDIALQKGKYEAYRNLQATVIAHYFDLTHPLEEVTRINKALREQPPQIAATTRPARESIERLVVPRVLRYTEDAALEAAHELTNTEKDHPVRSLRRHDVVWHIRKLPEGWSPSPAALELAEKLRVTLGPHETIVKEHKRGTLLLGQVTAHHFVNRPS